MTKVTKRAHSSPLWNLYPVKGDRQESNKRLRLQTTIMAFRVQSRGTEISRVSMGCLGTGSGRVWRGELGGKELLESSETMYRGPSEQVACDE